jgi:hypothetical protein
MSLDCSIPAGTNVPIVFVMPADFDMSGRVFELVVWWDEDRRVYTQSTGLSVSGREVTWSFPVADSRAFPPGRVARIELQWTSGSVQDRDIGFLTVETGGSND